MLVAVCNPVGNGREKPTLENKTLAVHYFVRALGRKNNKLFLSYNAK